MRELSHEYYNSNPPTTILMTSQDHHITTSFCNPISSKEANDFSDYNSYTHSFRVGIKYPMYQ